MLLYLCVYVLYCIWMQTEHAHLFFRYVLSIRPSHTFLSVAQSLGAPFDEPALVSSSSIYLSFIHRALVAAESTREGLVAGPLLVFGLMTLSYHTYALLQLALDARAYTYRWASYVYKLHRADTLTYMDMLPVVLFNQMQILVASLVVTTSHAHAHTSLRALLLTPSDRLLPHWQPVHHLYTIHRVTNDVLRLHSVTIIASLSIYVFISICIGVTTSTGTRKKIQAM